jgi:hypothetical protein
MSTMGRRTVSTEGVGAAANGALGPKRKVPPLPAHSIRSVRVLLNHRNQRQAVSEKKIGAFASTALQKAANERQMARTHSPHEGDGGRHETPQGQDPWPFMEQSDSGPGRIRIDCCHREWQRGVTRDAASRAVEWAACVM